MARPFTASDDEILLAARNVISRRGPEAFSIAEVASEVGLSRAAIILRFKSTQALKVASLNKMVEQFAAALESLPQTPGGDNLLRLAAFIGGHVRSRESSARFFASYSANIRDRELLKLEVRRGEALHTAISNVMPPVAIDHNSAVAAFSAHLTGSIVAWLGRDDPDSRRYLVVRTKEWLKLAGIRFNEKLVEELSAPPPAAATSAPARSRPPRSKTGRTRKRARPRLKSGDADR